MICEIQIGQNNLQNSDHPKLHKSMENMLFNKYKLKPDISGQMHKKKIAMHKKK